MNNKLHFNIDTLEQRLTLYRYLKYRYSTRARQTVLPYKIKVTNPYELGICFYLKHKTDVNFTDLPEMMSIYKTKKLTGVLIAPAGNLKERIKFINEVINITQNKLKNEQQNH